MNLVFASDFCKRLLSEPEPVAVSDSISRASRKAGSWAGEERPLQRPRGWVSSDGRPSPAQLPALRDARLILWGIATDSRSLNRRVESVYHVPREQGFLPAIGQDALSQTGAGVLRGPHLMLGRCAPCAQTTTPCIQAG